jgi:hypothetical protein
MNWRMAICAFPTCELLSPFPVSDTKAFHEKRPSPVLAHDGRSTCALVHSSTDDVRDFRTRRKCQAVSVNLVAKAPIPPPADQARCPSLTRAAVRRAGSWETGSYKGHTNPSATGTPAFSWLATVSASRVISDPLLRSLCSGPTRIPAQPKVLFATEPTSAHRVANGLWMSKSKLLLTELGNV